MTELDCGAILGLDYTLQQSAKLLVLYIKRFIAFSIQCQKNPTATKMNLYVAK